MADGILIKDLWVLQQLMNIHELRMRLQSQTGRRPKHRRNLPQLKVSLMNMNERLQPHLGTQWLPFPRPCCILGMCMIYSCAGVNCSLGCDFKEVWHSRQWVYYSHHE